MKLQACPMTLREANEFVKSYHRHNKPIPNNGGKFAIGCKAGESLIGVAIVGNPLSATYMDGYTAEVLRVCVLPDAQKGANSFLYSRCWLAWKAMGGKRLITYTLTDESGASLRGAGWKILHQTIPNENAWQSKSKRDGVDRQWQPIYGQTKFCWVVE